jgi:hypothetical protein
MQKRYCENKLRYFTTKIMTNISHQIIFKIKFLFIAVVYRNGDEKKGYHFPITLQTAIVFI